MPSERVKRTSRVRAALPRAFPILPQRKQSLSSIYRRYVVEENALLIHIQPQNIYLALPQHAYWIDDPNTTTLEAAIKAAIEAANTFVQHLQSLSCFPLLKRYEGVSYPNPENIQLKHCALVSRPLKNNCLFYKNLTRSPAYRMAQAEKHGTRAVLQQHLPAALVEEVLAYSPSKRIDININILMQCAAYDFALYAGFSVLYVFPPEIQRACQTGDIGKLIPLLESYFFHLSLAIGRKKAKHKVQPNMLLASKSLLQLCGENKEIPIARWILRYPHIFCGPNAIPLAQDILGSAIKQACHAEDMDTFTALLNTAKKEVNAAVLKVLQGGKDLLLMLAVLSHPHIFDPTTTTRRFAKDNLEQVLLKELREMEWSGWGYKEYELYAVRQILLVNVLQSLYYLKKKVKEGATTEQEEKAIVCFFTSLKRFGVGITDLQAYLAELFKSKKRLGEQPGMMLEKERYFLRAMLCASLAAWGYPEEHITAYEEMHIRLSAYRDQLYALQVHRTQEEKVDSAEENMSANIVQLLKDMSQHEVSVKKGVSSFFAPDSVSALMLLFPEWEILFHRAEILLREAKDRLQSKPISLPLAPNRRLSFLENARAEAYSVIVVQEEEKDSKAVTSCITPLDRCR